ncbi:MAG: hypothetical protein RR578_00225 [Bacilli bacterium]
MADINKIEELLTTKLSEIEYTLYSMKLQNEKDGMYLHIIVDRDEPISLSDIVLVSNLINEVLDSSKLLDIKYTLDISSLGAEKPIEIKSISKYVGKYINIHLLDAYNGMNYIEGTLEAVENDTLTISFMNKTRKVNLDIALGNIDKAHLAVKL